LIITKERLIWIAVSVSGTRVDGVARLDVDDLPQQSVRDPPMAFRIINSDGRGFCVEADDDADPLTQMFVGEADGVANEEFLSLSSRWRRRRRVSWAARSVRDNRRVEQRPTLTVLVVLDHRLGLPQLHHRPVRRWCERIAPDITDLHSQMQALTYLENASRVVQHFADGEKEAKQLGAGRLPKRVENVHECVGV